MPIQPSSYKEAIRYLYNLETYGIRLGLKRVTALLNSLDNPQNKLSIIHIGGTNGKGSTSAMIASILQKSGYKVGLYTSPHLNKFNERIRVNGRAITDRRIVFLVKKIRSIAERQNIELTFFEFTTAMAFLYFAEEEVEIAVIEVGLGGRLDATNVCKPIVSVITNITKDHEAQLGDKISDIAFEKAGIIKNNGILISAETKPVALRVLRSECKKKRAEFYRINEDFFVYNNLSFKKGEVGSSFTFKGRRWFLKKLNTRLLGRHQYINAACALASLEVLAEEGYEILEYAIRKGFQDVFWPGRLEVVSEKPLVVLDSAHNPAGADILSEALQSEFNYKRLFLVVGIMKDKDIKGILSRLLPLAHTAILTQPQIKRAASLTLLDKYVRPYSKKVKLINNVEDACRTALSMSSAADMVCITGSIFTVGEARRFLLRVRTGRTRDEK